MKPMYKMNFESKNSLKEDPLWLTYLFGIGLLQWKPTRTIFVISFLLYSIIFVIELHALYINPSYCFRYGPWMLVKQFGFINFFIIFNDWETIGNLWQNFDRWTLDSAGPGPEDKIAKKVFRHQILIASILAIAGVYGLLVFLPNPSDNEFYLIQYIFEQNYQEYSSIFCVFGKIIHVPICYLMLTLPFVVFHTQQHCIYQCTMYLEHLKNLSFDFERYNDWELLYNLEYQKLIHERLKYCIKRHIDYIKFFEEYAINVIKRWFVLYLLSSFLTGIGLGMLVYALYNNILNFTLHNMAIVVTLVALVLINFCHFIHAGQTAENESAYFFLHLIETRWLTWSKSNRMTLWLMMLKSEPMKVNFFENMALNYELGISIARGVHSVISLFMSIRSSGYY